MNAGRCASTTARCRSGCSIPAGGCRGRARSTICRWRGFSGRRRAKRSARSSLARERSIDGWSSRSLLAALNIDPPQGAARLAAAIIRETLAVGGRACRPLIARDGLGSTLIEPALAFYNSAAPRCAWSINCARMRFSAERVEALDFGSETVALEYRRSGRPRGPALCGYVADNRARSANRIPRHRQRDTSASNRLRGYRRSSACSMPRCNGSSPFPAGCRSPSAPATGSSIRRAKNWQAAVG